MVEGHSVHRVAARFRSKFVGHAFNATSPNGRFAEGAQFITGRKLHKIEAVGKNLFAFFGSPPAPLAVVHVHFGMSGRWSIYPIPTAPKPTPTTRLILSNQELGVTAHLSAMTVTHGGASDLFETVRRKLGEDPLRDDADVTLLRERVQQSKKSISKLLMDQAYFAGVGNIYRAEILFCSSLHPETKGRDLSDQAFDTLWAQAVKLMKRGFDMGRISSTTDDEAKQLGDANRRRYVYNQARCIVCKSSVSNWKEAGRTVWACLKCQAKTGGEEQDPGAELAMTEKTEKGGVLVISRKRKRETPGSKGADDGAGEEGGNRSGGGGVFFSRCASEPLAVRRRHPQKLLVKELRQELERKGYPTGGSKAVLVSRLQKHLDDLQEHTADFDASDDKNEVHGYNRSKERR